MANIFSWMVFAHTRTEPHLPFIIVKETHGKHPYCDYLEVELSLVLPFAILLYHIETDRHVVSSLQQTNGRTQNSNTEANKHYQQRFRATEIQLKWQNLTMRYILRTRKEFLLFSEFKFVCDGYIENNFSAKYLHQKPRINWKFHAAGPISCRTDDTRDAKDIVLINVGKKVDRPWVYWTSSFKVIPIATT